LKFGSVIGLRFATIMSDQGFCYFVLNPSNATGYDVPHAL